MKVYVFGNEDVDDDRSAIDIAKKLKGKVRGTQFVFINPNEDLHFYDESNVLIMDSVSGIDEVTLIEEKDLHKLIIGKSVSVHDWDLGFQLKYLKKLGKLKNIKIVGIPREKKVDHFLVQSILRKLVAQEMQGS